MTQQNQIGDRSNPFASAHDVVRQSYQLWQQLARQYIESLTANQQLLDMTGQTITGSLQIKQQVDRMVEATVASMQLPTRSDMDRTLQKLTELEALLRELNEKIDRLSER